MPKVHAHSLRWTEHWAGNWNRWPVWVDQEARRAQRWGPDVSAENGLLQNPCLPEREIRGFTFFAYLLNVLNWKAHNPKLKEWWDCISLTSVSSEHTSYTRGGWPVRSCYWIYSSLVVLKWGWGETSWAWMSPCHTWARQSHPSIGGIQGTGWSVRACAERACVCVFAVRSHSHLYEEVTRQLLCTLEGLNALPRSPLLASLDIRVNTRTHLIKCFCCETAKRCQIQMVMLTSQ